MINLVWFVGFFFLNRGFSKEAVFSIFEIAISNRINIIRSMIGLRVVCNRIDLKSGGVVNNDAIIFNVCLLLLVFQCIVITFKLIYIIKIKWYDVSLLCILDDSLSRMEKMVSISKQIM